MKIIFYWICFSCPFFIFGDAIEPTELFFPSPIERAVTFLRMRCAIEPEIGMILPPLQKLPDGLEVEVQIAYDSIPFFPYRTMEFRPGALLFGSYQGVPMVALQGIRLYREGNFQQQPLIIAVVKELGVKRWAYINSDGEVKIEPRKDGL